jgi:hypothetical protein
VALIRFEGGKFHEIETVPHDEHLPSWYDAAQSAMRDVQFLAYIERFDIMQTRVLLTLRDARTDMPNQRSLHAAMSPRSALPKDIINVARTKPAAQTAELGVEPPWPECCVRFTSIWFSAVAAGRSPATSMG